MDAFWTLSSCRSIGMGYGPIPWTAVDLYCQRHEMDDVDALIFTAVIREMDAAYLTWHAENKPKPE